ncbi:MAG TPA: glycosyltransferase family 4 protein [Burkholderiaceae bacterium]|nr:glycosyltransferase family 4 protein [Burkholderiaceae bacterium]
MKPSPDVRMRDARTRVLLLTDEMEVGGTQRQIVHIAKGLDRRRFDPSVVFFRNRSFLADELVAAGVPVLQVAKRGRIDPLFVRELVGHLWEGRYHVMHCFAFSGELWGTIARQLLPASRRPTLVSSVRGTYEWYSPLQWRVKRWVSGRSASIVANSSAGAAYAKDKLGLADRTIDIVYNGVEMPAPRTDTAQDLRHTMVREGEVLALFVGRLIVHKNLPTLLRACELLRQRGVAVRMAIAGDGPLRADVEDRIRAQGLREHVLLLGQRADVAELMAAADLVVLPSLREGLSNVILEGMMSGKPVVASRAGGNVELVEHGRTGLLFETEDACALADAMQTLALDPDLRRSLGEAGRARALERHSVSAMVHAFERRYAELRTSGRGGPALSPGRTVG